MSKPLLKFELFGHYLTVDELNGYGTEYATLALREMKAPGHVGRRVKLDPKVTRSGLIELAFGLLDVADLMQPKATFASTATVLCELSEPTPGGTTFSELAAEAAEADIDGRRRDVAQRFQRLRDRMPELQLAQRVLERCSNGVAHTLAALLVIADQTGDLPVRAGIPQLVPAQQAMKAVAEAPATDANGNTTKH